MNEQPDQSKQEALDDLISSAVRLGRNDRKIYGSFLVLPLIAAIVLSANVIWPSTSHGWISLILVPLCYLLYYAVFRNSSDALAARAARRRFLEETPDEGKAEIDRQSGGSQTDPKSGR